MKAPEPTVEQKEEQKTEANKQEAPVEEGKEVNNDNEPKKDVEMAYTEAIPEKAENQEQAQA